jgi:hypothetical protein
MCEKLTASSSRRRDGREGSEGTTYPALLSMPKSEFPLAEEVRAKDGSWPEPGEATGGERGPLEERQAECKSKSSEGSVNFLAFLAQVKQPNPGDSPIPQHLKQGICVSCSAGGRCGRDRRSRVQRLAGSNGADFLCRLALGQGRREGDTKRGAACVENIEKALATALVGGRRWGCRAGGRGERPKEGVDLRWSRRSRESRLLSLLG